MKTRPGFALVELLLVITLLAFLVLFLAVPAGKGARAKSARIECVNNLKNLGLGARVFAAAKGNGLPGESLTGVTNRMDSARYFRIFGAELNTPGLLHCPADSSRAPGTSFQTLATTNISYFGSLNAPETRPDDFLFGDRNLQTGGANVPAGIFLLSSNRVAEWSREIHDRQGNITMSDGSVRQFNSAQLQAAITGMGAVTNILVFP